MKARRLRLAIFAVVAIVQLSVPLWMIFEREQILRHGELWRFRTAPVDPYDAFRGRYVALAFDMGQASVPEGMEVRRHRRLYALLERDSEGFAKLSELANEQPATGAYLTVRVRWHDPKAGTVSLDLPFDRYYLNEDLAPEAERLYQRQTSAARDAYVEVRVYRGRGVLEQLYVAGRPIQELVETSPPL